MNDFDDECEHDECDIEVPGAPMTVWDFVVAFFAFWCGVGQAFTTSMEFLARSSAMANNHAASQKDFENEARRAIEAIPVAKDEA